VRGAISLRGKVSAFDITDDRVRAQWARRLRDAGCDFLIFDCLRPLLDALGLDENKDCGKVLVAFDALLDEAGVTDALVVHHMGHGQERARGDSRLLDWPDAIWSLVREDDNPHSKRFFRAHGRDVDVAEGEIAYDPATRRLTYQGGSRAQARTNAALAAVLDVLGRDAADAGEGLSTRGIEQAVDDHPRAAVREAIRLGIARGRIEVFEGQRRAKLHRAADACTFCGLRVIGPQGAYHFECARAQGSAE
jgi:hypothetical protein